jgi:hypothetical protein
LTRREFRSEWQERQQQQGTTTRKPTTAVVVAAGTRLTKAEARKRTDKVKAVAVALWLDLYELHQDGAHEALGYGSWGEYVEAEFGFTRVHAHRLVKAAKVMDALGGNPGVTGWGERHLRELVPLLQDSWGLELTVQELVAAHPKKPTVSQVRENVQARLAAAKKVEEPPARDEAELLDADNEGEPTLNGDLLDQVKAKKDKHEPVKIGDRVRELAKGGDTPATISRKLYEEIPAVSLTATDVRALTIPPDLIEQLAVLVKRIGPERAQDIRLLRG